MTDTLLTEIQQDLDNERLNSFFKKYGKAILSLAVIFVLGVAGSQIYKNYDLKKRTEAGDKLYAVISDFQGLKDTKDLEEIQKTNGYKEVGALVEANFHEKQKSQDALVKSYEKIANNSSANAALKELAELNLVSAKLNKDPADSTAEADLKKLTAEGATFKYTALEMLGSYYLKNGKNTEARAAYTKLADDENAPQSLSGRARSMLGSF